MHLRSVVILLAVAGCGARPDVDAGVPDSGEYVPRFDGGHRPFTRVPKLTAVSPSTASAGGPALVLTLDGDFDPDARVQWDGRELVTRVTSTTKLEADVPATALESSGLHLVSVVLIGENGGASGALPFTVVDGPAIPQLDMLAPSRAFSGQPAFEATVTGWSFTRATVAKWNGAARATTFVSSGELKLAILAADVASAGAAMVTVETPGATAPSNALTFTIDPTVVSPGGGLERVSVTPDGGESPAAVRDAAMSADGRYVAYSAFGDERVEGDTNNAEDVFLRDTCRGASGCTPRTWLVSLSEDGGPGEGDSRYPAVSASGRYVAFVSQAPNLTEPRAQRLQNLYVRDTCLGASGCSPTTLRVSVLMDGGEANDGAERPFVSADGRYVAFTSMATDYVENDTPNVDVFLRDTCLGAAACTPSTMRVTENLAGEGIDGPATQLAVSATGRFVVFAAFALNLDAGLATTGHSHAWVKDLCLGAPGCTPSLVQVDVGHDGGEADGFIYGRSLAVSPDGRYALFGSSSQNLTPQTTGSNTQLFLRDTCTGAAACTPSTTMVSVSIAGQGGSRFTDGAAMTPDGRYVAFVSRADDLVPGDTNGIIDLFVRDLCTGASGCTPATRRVSVAADGGQPNQPANNERPPGLSANGANACWATSAALVDGDLNSEGDAYVAETGF